MLSTSRMGACFHHGHHSLTIDTPLTAIIHSERTTPSLSAWLRRESVDHLYRPKHSCAHHPSLLPSPAQTAIASLAQNTVYVPPPQCLPHWYGLGYHGWPRGKKYPSGAMLERITKLDCCLSLATGDEVEFPRLRVQHTREIGFWLFWWCWGA
jgi:hypothetical protein